MRGTILITATCLVAMLFAGSCKRGCTNPSAANYDKTAKEEDASCLYCDSANMGFLNDYYTFSDYTPNSTHYSEYVLKVSYNTVFYSYSGNGCTKLLSLSGGCANQDMINSSTNLNFENQTNDTMLVSTWLTYYSGSSGNLHFDTLLTNVTVPPYGTTNVLSGLKFNCMQFVTGGSILLNSTTFTYQ